MAPIAYEPGDLLTLEELAGRLKVKNDFIYYHVKKARGKEALPFIRMGRYLRFSWKAVSAWLDARKAA